MVTSPKIIFIVVCSLALIVLLGLAAMFYLILVKTEGALIGIISGPTSIALGSLISLLNNTRTQAAPSANPTTAPDPTIPDATAHNPTPVVVQQPPGAPVPVTESKP